MERITVKKVIRDTLEDAIGDLEVFKLKVSGGVWGDHVKQKIAKETIQACIDKLRDKLNKH